MLDDRIDRTARQLTAGALADDFRARVLNRIDSGRRRSSIVAWTAVAAVAAVAIVAGVLTLRPTRSVPTSAEPISAAPSPSERSESRGALPALPALPTPPALPAPPALSESQSRPGFEPIAPDPLAIASIEIADLVPLEPADLRALSIEPIYTAPLDAAMEQR